MLWILNVIYNFSAFEWIHSLCFNFKKLFSFRRYSVSSSQKLLAREAVKKTFSSTKMGS